MVRHTSMTKLLQTLVLTLLASQIDSAFLSWNKSMRSSRTYANWIPQNAIDGNQRRDGDHCQCCAATNGELNPWYELDLGKHYSVHRIHVEGRTDYNGHHFQNMRILLHNADQGIDNRVEFSVTNVTRNVNYILPEPKSTRYVLLALFGVRRVFTICELTVYGECADGEFEYYCEHVCHCDGDPCNKTTGVCPSGKCLPGYKGTKCDTVCQDYTYGSGCTESCGNCLGTDICNKQSGRCPGQCANGYQGDTCKQECNGGFYGYRCYEKCGYCHNNESCITTTGTCENGCVPGYKGDKCETECTLGAYGAGCTEQCGNCSNGTTKCATTNGYCPAGCKAGYKGMTCKTECDDSTYGINCVSACGKCANGAACNKRTGVCDGGCSAGYGDRLCINKCQPGRYGKDCNSKCGNCLIDRNCHHIHGECIDGCIAGFKVPMCNEECDNGTFGNGCLERCGHCLDNAMCNNVNGTCPGCEEGYTRHDCKLKSTGGVSGPGSLAAAISGAVGGISFIIVVIIIITVRRRRVPESSNSVPDVNDPESIGNAANKRNVAERQPSSELKEIRPKSKMHANPSTKSNTETDMYSGFLTRATDLKICQLWDYIAQKKKEDNLLFYQEFNCLTSGLQHSHEEVALMKENRPLNRDKAMCAYDHSRVPLDTSDGGNDYINASFINGTKTPRKFIASQGPTVAMRNDFWRMIWQYNSSRIVMLTNLIEMGKEKCLIYWPEEESADVTYGNITVSLVSKDVTTDYDIRKLKVRKISSPARSVTQYHFKAWPDKGVPDSTWPLVKFWRTLMEDNIGGTAPIVVHCSEGIGRIGTFIAMDNAYNQAKETGKITMLDLVKTLRDQRVDMVQTKEQYVFLHEAVADALLFGTHIMWSREFKNIYKFLTQLDCGRSMLPMQEQFNLILESLEDRKKYEQRNDAAVPADIYGNISTNSAPAKTSIAGFLTKAFEIDKIQQPVKVHEYMPKSKSVEDVREHGAVLLPNYEMKDAFIVCRSPTEASFEGLWSIISEQNIEIVVMLTDSTSNNYKKCKELGASDKKVESSFRVKYFEEPMTSTCFHKRFTFQSNDGPKTVSQFEFRKWPKECMVPKDSMSMLDFLEIVLLWQQRLKSAQPILVHCSSDFERSGLVCVLLNELKRMKREQGQINILETVKLMKERNEHIIPNFEQYKYVYDTILETFHLESGSEEIVLEDNVCSDC